MIAQQKLCNKQQLCNLVKFIAALLVVNGHLFLFGNYNGILNAYMDLGACCVSLFFFFSGYGLLSNFKLKGCVYLNSFFNKRFSKIIIPLLTAYLISLPIYVLIKGPIDIKLLCETLFWGGPYLRYSWYVSEILIVYVLFYFAMKQFTTIRMKIMLLSVVIIAFMAILYVFKQPLWYLISLPGFILGMWYQYFENLIITHIKKEYLFVVTIIIGGIWFYTWQWSAFEHTVLSAFRYTLAAMIISSFLFPILIISIIRVTAFTPPHSLIISSSYEVYLIQNAAMMLASFVSASFVSYWIATMVIVIGLACVQFRIDRKLMILLKF